jgi:3-hydroxyisobutyrate dehydrogenase-like beta-hydroxyacid dehydrogenase
MTAPGPVTSPPVVGFVGVGQMGRPMVDRLLAARLPLVFFARRPEVVAEVTAAGGRALGSPAEVAAVSDVLIVCMFSDDQLRSVLLDDGTLAALRPGSIVLNHTTGSPALARELAAAAPEGVAFLDCPVSGSAEDIAAGRLTVLVGGDPVVLERARPALDAYSEAVIHLGEVGAGQIVKLLNNLLFTVHLGLAGRMEALAGSVGVDRVALAQAVQRSSGQSYALDLLAFSPFEAVAPAAGPFLRKDVAVIRSVAAELGVDLGVLGDLARWVDDLPT